MIKVEIPEEAFWAAIGFLLVTAVTALLWFFTWKGRVMTFSAHEKICGKSQQTIVDMLNAQNTSSTEYRVSTTKTLDTITSDVGGLKTAVAVLQATQGVAK